MRDSLLCPGGVVAQTSARASADEEGSMRTPTGAILFRALCAAAFPMTRCELEDYIPSGSPTSLGVGDDEMTVTWRTAAPTGSVVEVRTARPPRQRGPLANLPESQSGESSEFEDGGKARTRRVMHAVTLTGLEPGAKYSYRVGDPTRMARSQVFWFTAKRTPRQIAEGPPLKILAVCDIGHEESAELLSFVRSEVHDPRTHGGRVPDFLIHCGDFAYDLHGDDGAVGDAFMEDIQPIAAYLPYMTSAGNHESAYNFSHYTNRFNMPGEDAKRTGNHYYSFDGARRTSSRGTPRRSSFPNFSTRRTSRGCTSGWRRIWRRRTRIARTCRGSSRIPIGPCTARRRRRRRRRRVGAKLARRSESFEGAFPAPSRAFAAQLTGRTGEPAEEPAWNSRAQDGGRVAATAVRLGTRGDQTRISQPVRRGVRLVVLARRHHHHRRGFRECRGRHPEKLPRGGAVPSIRRRSRVDRAQTQLRAFLSRVRRSRRRARRGVFRTVRVSRRDGARGDGSGRKPEHER